MRKFAGEKLLIATHNKGKAREIAQLLSVYVKDYKTSADLNLPEPEETGESFTENAILKARLAAQASGLLALADDSGLSVHALGGAPGIYSARWGGPEKDFDKAMARVNQELSAHQDKRAVFVCTLAVAWPDGHAQSYEGRIEGEIVWPARGDGGFGYDPIFIPQGYSQTFAEMTEHEKQNISHRARAFEALVRDFFAP